MQNSFRNDVFRVLWGVFRPEVRKIVDRIAAQLPPNEFLSRLVTAGAQLVEKRFPGVIGESAGDLLEILGDRMSPKKGPDRRSSFLSKVAEDLASSNNPEEAVELWRRRASAISQLQQMLEPEKKTSPSPIDWERINRFFVRSGNAIRTKWQSLDVRLDQVARDIQRARKNRRRNRRR